jgi:hypothetical protein
MPESEVTVFRFILPADKGRFGQRTTMIGETGAGVGIQSIPLILDSCRHDSRQFERENKDSIHGQGVRLQKAIP